MTVRSGNTVVCVIKLDQDGTGTCQVGTKGLAPGKLTYTGTYSGSTGYKSSSGSVTVTLQPPKQSS